jgi:hypothetical protein
MANNFREVFLLSLISNVIRNSKGSVATLQDAVQTKIPWRVKLLRWGLVVWKADPDNTLTGPDHVWYAAKKAGPGAVHHCGRG